MECKISSFSIVFKALQILCKRLDCDFIDFPVKFDKKEESRFKDNCIYLKEGGTLLDTMSSIYSIYINSLSSICGRNIDNVEFKNSLMNLFLSLLRDFKMEYGNKALFDKNDIIAMKLDQFHVSWMLLKNIFCPYKNIPLKNIKIVAKSSEMFDVVLSVCEEDEPYLFVNLDIEKNSVRSAFLLVESLRIMMKDSEYTPESLVREVFSNFFMRDRLLDFLGVAFVEDSEVSNFLATLSILCQSKDLEDTALSIKKNNTKTAQANPYVGNFWFLGLTEKMMDSVRGSDWSTTKSLQDFSKDLWDRVEVERKSRGLTELPFELLLRVQSRDLETPPNQTLQQLLSKTRIW